eukprot:TRINITY_DN348_c0_g1_i2.p1 TRINITY_DN348_c0_g1~~TRINITY_DN348_c0_g1_i2.p1  ORF type:complete len:205 (-),score=15.67 TRINITY_DN348_c0_g1_i2:77-691(-)
MLNPPASTAGAATSLAFWSTRRRPTWAFLEIGRRPTWDMFHELARHFIARSDDASSPSPLPLSLSLSSFLSPLLTTLHAGFPPRLPSINGALNLLYEPSPNLPRIFYKPSPKLCRTCPNLAGPVLSSKPLSSPSVVPLSEVLLMLLCCVISRKTLSVLSFRKVLIQFTCLMVNLQFLESGFPIQSACACGLLLLRCTVVQADVE